MHTVELLEQSLDLAKRLGYEIRQECLGGGGGGCELRGRKVFFLDLALTPCEQLDQLVDTLSHEPRAVDLPMHHELRDLLKVRKSA